MPAKRTPRNIKLPSVMVDGGTADNDGPVQGITPQKLAVPATTDNRLSVSPGKRKTSTRSSVSSSSSRLSSATAVRREEQKTFMLLTEKVEDLERQVATLKTRHTSLKRAKHELKFKNETRVKDISSANILPSENVLPPPTGRRNTWLEMSIQNMDARLKSEKDQLRKQHKADLMALKKSLSCFQVDKTKKLKLLQKNVAAAERKKKEARDEAEADELELERLQHELEAKEDAIKFSQTEHADGECTDKHVKVIAELEKLVRELEGTNAALLVEKTEIEESMKKTKEDMKARQAEFEANTSDKVFNEQLETRWQQMYKDWMFSTEEKICELQQSNALLESMLQPKKS